MLHNFKLRAERFPPILVRLLARHHPRGEPLSLNELAERSGLSPARVDAISQSTNWRGIDFEEMCAFTSACEVDLFNRRQMKRIAVYLQGSVVNGRRLPPSFAYLKRSEQWVSYYRPLLNRYLKDLSSKIQQ